MHVGLIGLGKMGYNLGLNMMDHAHQVTAYDVNEDAVARFAAEGGSGVHSLDELVRSLPSPRVLWVMVPHQFVDNVLADVKKLLAPGDIVIEGGNSKFDESIRRAEEFKQLGMFYFDVGTSGGMEGARHGACYMIGGDADVFKVIEPLFKDTAVPNGYAYMGPSGSGHFTKMVHNGVEYGMMAAIGEGFEVLENSQFDLDYETVARVWANGSVIRGWLMDLTLNAFSKDPKLSSIKGVMQASGEGLWTVEEALRTQTPVPIIALSLMMRNRSLTDDTFTGKVVAALRNEFGGHAIETKGV
ncbi:phosphogluconate dehydrogenase (NAD(+)-dependent, decarboxylating) [Alicyclobacillus dauci]|uniref:Decarboxylating 6-phosphogluconate dehydrogenase n=1 Tax=Alicyclobacillus dauci TaxID=1475485 RepID=A0ABY6Z8I9_9BACL|nr:decarboxylating 6-phosphogluconate dehydrogenase [Alicyclobacillus dauci]WAH38887.1 decarboxylating 6-phosphogluconate dehydrogenase [Alicyclobacillus dauci]